MKLKKAKLLLIFYIIIYFVVVLAIVLQNIKLGVNYRDIYKHNFITFEVSGSSTIDVINDSSSIFKIEAAKSENVKVKDQVVSIKDANVKIYTGGKKTLIFYVRKNSNAYINVKGNLNSLFLAADESNVVVSSNSINSTEVKLNNTTMQLNATELNIVKVNLDKAYVVINAKNQIKKLVGNFDKASKIILSVKPQIITLEGKGMLDIK